MRPPKCGSESNIIMELKEIGWEGVNWIHVVKDRDQKCDLVNTVMNLQIPWWGGGFLDQLSDYQLLKDCAPKSERVS
jgi:hypothetical protein